jgi:hypothetical protein
MSEEARTNTPRVVRSTYPPIILIALALAMILWSFQYNETARQVPLITSYALLILAAMDLLCRFAVPALSPLRDFWGADFRNREMKHEPAARSELAEIAWMVACAMGMLLVGILPTVPAFVFLYSVSHGRRQWRMSAITALVVLAFIYVIFELLLQYELYRGALFDERGFYGW